MLARILTKTVSVLFVHLVQLRGPVLWEANPVARTAQPEQPTSMAMVNVANVFTLGSASVESLAVPTADQARSPTVVPSVRRATQALTRVKT